MLVIYITFVSKNVVICPDGTFQVLKYLCDQNDLYKTNLKTRLEALGRILRLKWHFSNEENF